MKTKTAQLNTLYRLWGEVYSPRMLMNKHKYHNFSIKAQRAAFAYNEETATILNTLDKLRTIMWSADYKMKSDSG